MRSTDARPMLSEIRRWPATVAVADAASALGCSRAHAYEAIRNGSFPARTLRVGKRIVVVTSSIVAALDGAEAPEQARETA